MDLSFRVPVAIVGLFFIFISPCATVWNGTPQKYEIRTTWDNQTIGENHRVTLTFSSTKDDLIINMIAPFYNDPKPPGNPGRFYGLWEYEVVEVFFLGLNHNYLELEFGPFGHYLALYLEGKRHVTNPNLFLPQYTADYSNFSWRGRAIVPKTMLPPGVNSFNAYAIHGEGAQRLYLSLFPVEFNSSAGPDFHRLDAFQPIDLSDLIEVQTSNNI